MNGGNDSNYRDAVKVYLYIDVAGLQHGCGETCGATKRRVADDPEEGYSIDLGHFVASILGKLGLGTCGKGVQINLYGAAPSTTDTIRRSVNPMAPIIPRNVNSISDHVPRPGISILANCVVCVGHHFYKGGRAIFILICDEFEHAVRTIAGHGFDAHVWCWKTCHPEDYKSVRGDVTLTDHVHIHTIEDHPRAVDNADNAVLQRAAAP